MVREKDYDNSENFQNVVGGSGQPRRPHRRTFLHSSRANPSKAKKASVPPHLQSAYNAEKSDLTQEVLKNLDWLGIDYLIPIAGDD